MSASSIQRSGTRSTNRIIDIGMSNTTGVLLEGGQRLWVTEQKQRLVDEVGSQIVNLTGSGRRFVLPGPLQSRSITVNPREFVWDVSHRKRLFSVIKKYLDSNSQTSPRY